MSQENVEIVKRAIDAFNRHDVEAYADLVTSDFEVFPAMMGVLEGASYGGREGVETYLGEVRDTWEEYRVVADELRDLGDRVLMLGWMQGRGRGSGVQVDAPVALVADFRDGKLSRSTAYLDHGEALRAAGLAE
jgi:ketosteroid isomerase-like protein